MKMITVTKRNSPKKSCTTNISIFFVIITFLCLLEASIPTVRETVYNSVYFEKKYRDFKSITKNDSDIIIADQLEVTASLEHRKKVMNLGLRFEKI